MHGHGGRLLTRLRLGLLAAIAAMLCVAPAAQADHAAFLDPLTTRDPGCQVKGLFGSPFGNPATPGLPANNYFYEVTAVVNGVESASTCEYVAVPVDPSIGRNGSYVQWNPTPGATAYNVYRASTAPTGFVKVFTAPTTTTAVSGCNGAPQRCYYLDFNPTPGSGAPPATAATRTAALSNAEVVIPQRIDYSGSDTNPADDATTNDPNAVNPPALATDDFRFPPGLNANPVSAPKCTLAELLGDTAKHGTSDAAEDKCPRASQVGTVQVLARSGNPATNTGRLTLIQGDIYNGTPNANEAARLYVVLRPFCSAGSPGPIAPGGAFCSSSAGLNNANVEVEKSFLAAPATIVARDGSYGINVATVQAADGAQLSPTTNIIATANGSTVLKTTLQVRQLKQSLWGTVDQGTADTADDKPFMTLPSSCSAWNLLALKKVYSHMEDATGSAALQSTNCEAVPFDPVITTTVGGAGKTGNEQHPDFDATITQGATEGPIKTARVVLPEAIGTDLAAIANVCSDAQVASDTCPAASDVGSVAAASPLVPTGLSGRVYLVSSGGAFPKLVAVLSGGGVRLQLNGTIDIEGGARIVNVFDGIPDIPLSSFTLHIDGGSGGLLTNKKDLCSGAGNVDSTFTAHAGKVVTRNVPLTVIGASACVITPPTVGRPTASVILKKVKKPRPTLQLKIRRPNATQGTALRSARLTLPKGLRFVRRARSRQLSFADGRLMGNRAWTFTSAVATLRRSLGETEVIEVTFRRGSTRSSAAIRRKGVRQRLTYRIRVTDNGGQVFNLRVRSRPRR